MSDEEPRIQAVIYSYTKKVYLYSDGARVYSDTGTTSCSEHDTFEADFDMDECVHVEQEIDDATHRVHVEELADYIADDEVLVNAILDQHDHVVDVTDEEMEHTR